MLSEGPCKDNCEVRPLVERVTFETISKGLVGLVVPIPIFPLLFKKSMEFAIVAPASPPGLLTKLRVPLSRILKVWAVEVPVKVRFPEVEAVTVPEAPVQPPKKNFPKIVILLIVILLIGIGGVYAVRYFTRPKICTLEAKLCPDGSAVGRVLPNCEFAPCPTSAPTVPPATSTPDETANWKTYKGEKENVTFKYPPIWVEQPNLIRGSGFDQEIRDPEEKYRLTFSSVGNYNQVTGKQYVSLDEFEGMPYKVRVVIVDGQEGRQPLPRAGSENINAVNFFSKDSKFIYTLELQTGDTALNTSETDVQKGQQLFDQILSTFKFLE